MKRLVFTVIGVLIIVLLVAVGCVEEEGIGPPPEELVSSCVTCHSDKTILKELAVEPEVVEEEAAEG
jgi:hypothetical protein